MDLNTALTCHEAAEELGVTTNHIRLLLAKEKLSGQKKGSQWLITRDSIKAYDEMRIK